MSVHGSPQSLKRTHDSFKALGDLQEPFSVPTDFEQKHAQPTFFLQPRMNNTPNRDTSPARSNTGSLSDLGPTTPSDPYNSPKMSSSTAPNASNSPHPSSYTALNDTIPPPTKRTKMSFHEKEAEKEAKRIQKQFKDLAKAEERAKREADKQAQAEDKARKEAEQEKRRLAQEAEKVARGEKRRKKEEDKRRADEEKRKKERSQRTLGSFFGAPTATKTRRGSVDSKERSSMSPAPQNSNPTLSAPIASPAPTPSKAERSAYDKMFPEFFIKDEVRLAKINRFERDEESLEFSRQTLDSYILGNQSPGRHRSFDATVLFHLPGTNVMRGKQCIPVREIMAEFGDASRPIDPTTNSQNSQIKRRHDLLAKAPMKILHFAEDVRPPYRGTYTSRPINGVAKLARNPLRRDLPNTNYDWDSEAEWEEGENGEDCNSDGEEEEDGEDGEDMDGFLDDENDELANSKRMVIQGDLEPVSSGLCWEDKHKRSTNVKMLPYRMEIILNQSLKSIDPFSTSYWAPPPTLTAMDPPRLPLTTMTQTNISLNPASTEKLVPTFFAPISTATSTTGPSKSKKPSNKARSQKAFTPEDLIKFKEAIKGSNLTKAGLKEVLKVQFRAYTANVIGSTLDAVARRVGPNNDSMRWVLIEDTEMTRI